MTAAAAGAAAAAAAARSKAAAAAAPPPSLSEAAVSVTSFRHDDAVSFFSLFFARMSLHFYWVINIIFIVLNKFGKILVSKCAFLSPKVVSLRFLGGWITLLQRSRKLPWRGVALSIFPSSFGKRGFFDFFASLTTLSAPRKQKKD